VEQGKSKVSAMPLRHRRPLPIRITKDKESSRSEHGVQPGSKDRGTRFEVVQVISARMKFRRRRARDMFKLIRCLIG